MFSNDKRILSWSLKGEKGSLIVLFYEKENGQILSGLNMICKLLGALGSPNL